jgi:hypothetical protein
METCVFMPKYELTPAHNAVLFMQDNKFKIIIYDDEGIELLRSTRYRLNSFINDFIVNEVCL